jgi:hypothetical protein
MPLLWVDEAMLLSDDAVDQACAAIAATDGPGGLLTQPCYQGVHDTQIGGGANAIQTRQ